MVVARVGVVMLVVSVVMLVVGVGVVMLVVGVVVALVLVVIGPVLGRHNVSASRNARCPAGRCLAGTSGSHIVRVT